MTNAMQRRQDNVAFSLVPRNFQEALEFGKIMASSDLVPKDYRGKPGNVLVAVQMGADIGLSPMQAVQNIACINGRPALWGDAMLAVVQAHPACRGIHETYDAETQTAICEVQRAGRPMVSRTFSVEDAKRANLWGKQGPWTQYPQRMLQMRARGFALRDAFPDALRGLASAEEVEDYTVHARTGERTERPDTYVDAEVVATEVATDEPIEQPSVTYDDVVAAIEASETPDDLTNAARMARELTGEERSRAVELGANKRAELDALASAKQAAESAEQAAREMDDEGSNGAR